MLTVIFKASAESEIVHWTEQREMGKSVLEATVPIEFVFVLDKLTVYT